MRGRFRPHNVVKGFKKLDLVFLSTHFLCLPACAIFFCYFIVYSNDPEIGCFHYILVKQLKDSVTIGRKGGK